MNTTLPKKVNILSILNILQKYSDSEHPLKQKDIQAYLEEEYQMEINRRAVKRNLMNLIEFQDYALDDNRNFRIEKTEKRRTVTGKKIDDDDESIIYTDFYVQHLFDDSELELLIDSVIFSNHIPQKDRKDLIKRLKSLASVHFRNNSENIEVANCITTQNKQLFMVFEDINTAIGSNNKISFTYYKYNIDKKMEPECNPTVCPYRIVAKNNHYYLICIEEPFDTFTHYRLDKIKGLEILKDKFSPIKSIDLKKYIDSHPYMYSGEVLNVRMKIDEEIIGEVIDCFGDSFRVLNKNSINRGDLEIEIKSNTEDVYCWALQFGDYVEILEPQSLRDRMRETVETMHKKYYRTNDDRVQKSKMIAERKGYLDLSRVDLTKNLIDFKALNIKEIMLCDNNISDYSFVGDIDGLESIRMRGKVDNFDFLKNIKTLKLLMLKDTGFRDLSIIKNLPIKTLYLNEECAENTDVLYDMKDLKWLRVTRNIADLIDTERLKKANPKLKIALIRRGKELRLWEDI